jgi:hypothetical protein
MHITAVVLFKTYDALISNSISAGQLDIVVCLNGS